MAGKRGNGEGSIYQRRSDGRWVAALTLPNGKRKALFRATRAEAAEALVTWQHNASIGMLPSGEGERLSVAGYLDLWLASLRTRQLAEQTERNYRIAVAQALAAMPRLRRIKLVSLTASHLDQLYGARLDAGAAPSYVRLIHAMFHGALADAVRQHLIPRNVAELARPPRIRRKEMVVLPPEQAHQLIASALETGERLEALLAVALTTGMRRGELLGLRWRDIDLERGALSVQHTMLYRNVTTWRLTPPKTKASRRSIVLGTTATAALRRHRARQNEERLIAGPLWHDHDFVFATAIGDPTPTETVRRTLDRVLKRAGLPHIRFHDLRHTAATLLLADNMNPKKVSELLGHTSVSITLDRYSHVLPSMQRDVAAAMDRLLGFVDEDEEGKRGRHGGDGVH